MAFEHLGMTKLKLRQSICFFKYYSVHIYSSVKNNQLSTPFSTRRFSMQPGRNNLVQTQHKRLSLARISMSVNPSQLPLCEQYCYPYNE